MKRFTAIFVLTVILALALCGCGNDTADYNSDMLPNAGTTVSPMVSPDNAIDDMPYTSPAVDDGIVNDRDGYIEDTDNGSTNGTTNGSTNGTTGNTAVSPKVTSMP